MVQTLARCRTCGLPSRLAEALAWEGDGTIRARRFRGVRLAMLDRNTMGRTCDAARAAMDGEELFAREKSAARSLAALQLRGVKEKISRYGVVKKRVLEAMEDYSLILGVGRIEMERFAPGQGGSWMVKAAFDDTLLDAGIAGVLEELDACEYRRLHTEAGKDAYRLELRASGGVAQDAPPAGEVSEPAQGEGGGGRCGQCGLPLDMGAFSWNEIYGSMESFPGRLRVALVPSRLLEVLAEAAAKAAGREAPHPVQEAARVAALERLARPEEDVYDGARDFAALTAGDRVESFLRDKLGLRGWGRVRGFGMEEGGWRVEVAGPVDPFLVAGWLEAVFQAAQGRKARARLNEAAGAAVYLLR